MGCITSLSPSLFLSCHHCTLNLCSFFFLRNLRFFILVIFFSSESEKSQQLKARGCTARREGMRLDEIGCCLVVYNNGNLFCPSSPDSQGGGEEGEEKVREIQRGMFIFWERDKREFRIVTTTERQRFTEWQCSVGVLVCLTRERERESKAQQRERERRD